MLPADTPASVVYQRVKAVLEGNGVSDQEPDLDATAARRQQPLFGGTATDSGKVHAPRSRPMTTETCGWTSAASPASASAANSPR